MNTIAVRKEAQAVGDRLESGTEGVSGSAQVPADRPGADSGQHRAAFPCISHREIDSVQTPQGKQVRHTSAAYPDHIGGPDGLVDRAVGLRKQGKVIDIAAQIRESRIRHAQVGGLIARCRHEQAHAGTVRAAEFQCAKDDAARPHDSPTVGGQEAAARGDDVTSGHGVTVAQRLANLLQPATTLETMADPARMHRPAPEMTQLMLDAVAERLLEPEAPLDGLADRRQLAEALAGLITEEGRAVEDVLEVYQDHLAPTVLSADSPRMFAFIPSAPTKASLLFDMVVSAASLQGISWLEAAGAVMAEEQALRVLADIAGLPASAGGVFVSGGSAGNLSALVVAREHARRTGLIAPDAIPEVVVSDQAHSSIAQTLMITGMKARVIPTGEDGRLDARAIAKGLPGDKSSVCAIVATAGTTNAGIIDDIAVAAEVADGKGWWLHVDGAYGGAGMLVSGIRSLYDGIERADSIVMDPHKWWFAPFDCAALLYRDPRLAASVHAQDASYLDVIHGDEADLNPSDLAYHLTRRARGLPLWFSMAVNGLGAYRDAVAHGIELAHYAADRLSERDDCEVIRRPDLSIVLFRRRGWQADDYTRWSTGLLSEQRAFVTSSKWRGETVGRLAFLHPATTLEMVDEVIAALG